jgi:TIR domain
MADVFISYANENRDTARKLAASLEARGWSVWWDRKIQAGQTFDQVIERELETARCVIVLWSKESISSEWVKNEAALAAERGVLVPALNRCCQAAAGVPPQAGRRFSRMER